MTRPDPERSQPTADEHAQQAVRQQVLEGYAQIARSGQWSGVQASGPCGHADQGGGGCCGPTTVSATQVAQAVGYDAQQLDALPEGANLGLSCGNPTAIAGLRPGQVVLDLGSGAGMDCFLAGPRVGPTGRAIGVDMTPQMLARARANIAEYRARTGLDNVEFRLGEIEHLPVADASVDVVLSNCVINLSPDKPAVWREIVRVLKPGGTVAISDLALLRPAARIGASRRRGLGRLRGRRPAPGYHPPPGRAGRAGGRPTGLLAGVRPGHDRLAGPAVPEDPACPAPGHHDGRLPHQCADHRPKAPRIGRPAAAVLPALNRPGPPQRPDRPPRRTGCNARPSGPCASISA
ncbi:MAG: hypothetical protein KatS3mg103_1277 [Phycisphaerales bacterium]|nr:MAG: hypothetical protein KatS3mg103_1277 [Phycisphaerales bacterium]